MNSELDNKLILIKLQDDLDDIKITVQLLLDRLNVRRRTVQCRTKHELVNNTPGDSIGDDISDHLEEFINGQ